MDVKNTSNLEIHEKEEYVLISINPKIYPLEVVYSAAYVFLDRAYLLLDGNPDQEIIVELRPKIKCNLEEIGREFNNELLNYATYKKYAEKNDSIRQAIVHRALLTNSNDESEDIEEISEEDYTKDPEGIAIPWEEKYGKDKKQDDNKI
jgi:His-Xaa-Ser system protein HxsD